MYKSFDDVPEATHSKEREAMFASGSADEKLPQYITDAKEKHGKNVSALYTTIALFEDDELKRRHMARLNARLEQERKWVKHYSACEQEHKKGKIVAGLKTQLETARKEAIKKAASMREDYEKKMEELRKSCKIEYRKEWEAELKAKKKAKKEVRKSNGFWSWFKSLWSDKKPEEKPVATPVMKAAANTNTKPIKDRAFYLAKHAKKIAKNKAA